MLDRRSLIQAAGAGAAALASPAWARAPAAGEAAPVVRRFAVTTTIDLVSTAEPVQLWVPVFAAEGAAQKRLAIAWESEAPVQLTADPQSGAAMLHVRWDGAGQPRRLRVVERLATWDRRPAVTAAPLAAADFARWTRLGGGPADQALARRTAAAIVGSHREPMARLRAIYDWTIANTWRNAAVAGCGPGDALAMLREGRTGGKCADINGLTVCLARAAGLPARELYGVRLADSTRFASLGRSGEVTKAQHCRAEVWLPGRGWFAVDPADVRKVVLEEKLTLDSPAVRALADDLFGGAEGNWAAYNAAAPVVLPGAPHAPKLRYLMYPTALTAAAEIDSLDPARFTYRIDSHQIAA